MERPFNTIEYDLVDLRLFVNIADSNSLTHGAERSYMSLPAASMRIKNMEEKLNTQLLYRTNHGVQLTPAGETFLHYGRLILRQSASLSEELVQYARGAKGHVRILANGVSIIEFLPKVLKTFLADHPDVDVDLREDLSPEIVSAVSDGKADIGIITDTVETGALELLPYRRDRRVIATAATHPLADCGEINFSETLAFDYITLIGASEQQARAAQLRKKLKTRVRVGNFEAMCRMVEANAGIGMLYESVALRYAKNMAIKVIRLKEDWAMRELRLCARKFQGLPEFARDLVSLLTADSASSVSGPQ